MHESIYDIFFDVIVKITWCTYSSFFLSFFSFLSLFFLFFFSMVLNEGASFVGID